jgi:hypothetical protein
LIPGEDAFAKDKVNLHLLIKTVDLVLQIEYNDKKVLRKGQIHLPPFDIKTFIAYLRMRKK